MGPQPTVHCEILQDYAARDSRIKLVSEPDAGVEEAFWKVLQRCTGDIIGTCLSDEEMLPDAVAKAVEIFAGDPEAGAITGDGYTTDENGVVIGNFTAGEFNLIDYLFGRYCPFWPGSFFRTKALKDVGLSRSDWTLDCLEFEIWCRLGTDHVVKSVPDRFSKYAIHPGQLSNTPKTMVRHIDGRLAVIAEMFSEKGFFGANELWKTECMINQLSLFLDHARAYKLTAQEQEFSRRIEELSATLRGQDSLAYRVPYAVESKAATRTAYIWALAARTISPKLRAKLGPEIKKRLRGSILNGLLRLALLPKMAVQALRRPFHGGDTIKHGARDTAEARQLKRYLEAAVIYDARGQIRQALAMWKAAEPLKDATMEGRACQARLKLPSATERDIFDHQRSWARRHAKPNPRKGKFAFKRYDGRRKIKVGYHCGFFPGDVIRAMMQGAVEQHDRSKFVLYGYSPEPVPADMRGPYDFFRDTAFVRDDDFVDLVRKDEIDIFVELTGFSPGHRFAAMASRCAPVQVSYLNHTATSGVPNVDYVLSDEICTPVDPEIDACFSEKIYRLPGCFFCFDYDAMTMPPVAPPPSLARGTVTFGCFGSGGKINETLISYWAELLRRVPNSTFFIKNRQLDSAANRRFVLDRFRRYDVGADRLRVEAGSNRQTLLKCYDEVDITLDTWPYCGGNTVAESFWQGVPVVSLYGSRFSSRYGASLVTGAGCDDLIGRSPNEYIEIAATLAGNPHRLVQLRNDLRACVQKVRAGKLEAFRACSRRSICRYDNRPFVIGRTLGVQTIDPTALRLC